VALSLAACQPPARYRNLHASVPRAGIGSGAQPQRRAPARRASPSVDRLRVKWQPGWPGSGACREEQAVSRFQCEL